MASTIVHATGLSNPRIAPAMSDTNSQFLLANHPSTSGVFHPKSLPPARSGQRKNPMWPFVCGELAMEPPWPLKNFDERNRVRPGARMLIATPATTWSTPTTTVVRIISSAPTSPPSTPPSTPHHAPNFHPSRAAPHVPMIIMPSRAMFTMPARSL